MSLLPPNSSFDTSSEAQSRRARKRGSRAKLAQRFFEDLYAAWEEQGESVIARAAFHDPTQFLSIVARLMPQKIEVSTPTDGMSDERLAELLDMAEHMAALKAGQVIEGTATDVAVLPAATVLNHENAPGRGVPLEGGGGPDRAMAPRGVNTPNTIAAAAGDSAEAPVAQHNKLDLADEPRIAETPYPVGRVTPESTSAIERRNVAKLDAHEHVDPSSLF